jgi:hypothetical protein
MLEDFIRRYGDSFYGTLARARLEELKNSQVAALPRSSAESQEVPVSLRQAQCVWGMTAATSCSRSASPMCRRWLGPLLRRVCFDRQRSMIQERIRAGLARAKAAGKKFGRPKIDKATEAKMGKALRAGDMGMRKIAVEFGVGMATVQRIRADMRD